MDPVSGIYFRREDYASFWLRLLIDLIDGVTVLVFCGAAFLVLCLFLPGKLVLLVCAGILFCYFVLLKRSSGGTLGYRVAGVRIVGLDGRSAGLFPLTLRLMFMVLGPVNYLLDLAWLASDARRQTLRDKFARTYVVKKRAEPAGSGRLIYRYYLILGYNFLFREIEEADTLATAGAGTTRTSGRS
jgi:uncharacterized RDD family membrane protein YckC